MKNVVEPYLSGRTSGDKDSRGQTGCANILTLESGRPGSWKREAKRKIKMSQVVLFVLGDDTSKESKAKTMGWEAKQALKYNKQLMVIDAGNHELPFYLYQPDRFTKQIQPVAPIQTLSDVKKRIDDFDNGYYDIFSESYTNMDEEEKLSRNELTPKG